ncbi:MAG: hypothetical protein IPK26_21250 [Planctomycetes bacterium]|nr:hypothetical protein [Planctomycetota bacterium]
MHRTEAPLNPVKEAAERRLDQALRDEFAPDTDPDLAAAVVARAQAGDLPKAEAASSSRWRAALLMAAGVLVAVGTAVWSRQRPAVGLPTSAPQDPVQERPWVTVTSYAELEALDDTCRALRLEFWNTDPDRGGGLPAAIGLDSALNRASKVEHLDLAVGNDTNLPLTAADLQRLGQHTPLRELRGAGRFEIQPDWLASLAALPNLATLALPHVAIGDAGAAAIARIPNLQVLELAFDGTLTAAGLAALAGVPGLRSLGLRGCGALTAAGLAVLGKCNKLERLDLRFVCGQTTGAPRKIPARFLDRIEVMLGTELVAAAKPGGGGVDDGVLTALAAVGSLRELDLVGCPSITVTGLRTLAPLPLRRLGLSIRAGDAAAMVNELSPTIESLSLAWSSQFDDAALAAIAVQLPHLRELDLAQCPLVTDAGLAALLERTTLHRLTLRGCKGLTGAVLPALLAAKALRFLDVSGQRWVDADAERDLRALPAMQELRNEKGGLMAARPK